MFLLESVLDFFTHIHQSTHINFIEGSQRSISVLSILQSARDSVAETAHRDTSLSASAMHLCGRLLSLNLIG